MAIRREFYKVRQDGVLLYRTYSDENRMVCKIGTSEKYDEAIDVESAPFVYVEGDKINEINEV